MRSKMCMEVSFSPYILRSIYFLYARIEFKGVLMTLEEYKREIDALVPTLAFPTTKRVKWTLRNKFAGDSDEIKKYINKDKKLNDYIVNVTMFALETLMMNAVHSNQAAVIKHYLMINYPEYREQERHSANDTVVINFGVLDNTGKNKI